MGPWSCVVWVGLVALSVGGCRPNEAELDRQELLEQRIFADRMCACEDRGCARIVADEVAASRNPTKRKRPLTDEELAALTAESKRMTGCYGHLLRAEEPRVPTELQ
jgi:hypothetical protein